MRVSEKQLGCLHLSTVARKDFHHHTCAPKQTDYLLLELLCQSEDQAFPHITGSLTNF